MVYTVYTPDVLNMILGGVFVRFGGPKSFMDLWVFSEFGPHMGLVQPRFDPTVGVIWGV